MMAKSNKSKTTRRRTQVKQLPKRNKKLSSAELKKVKGGEAAMKKQLFGAAG